MRTYVSDSERISTAELGGPTKEITNDMITLGIGHRYHENKQNNREREREGRASKSEMTRYRSLVRLDIVRLVDDQRELLLPETLEQVDRVPRLVHLRRGYGKAMRKNTDVPDVVER